MTFSAIVVIARSIFHGEAPPSSLRGVFFTTKQSSVFNELNYMDCFVTNCVPRNDE